MWLAFAFIALLCFGLWGFATKLTLVYVNSQTAQIYQTIGVVLVGIAVFATLKGKPMLDMRGCGFGILTGVSYGLGCLFYFLAADSGKIITVVTLTALYPIVTIALAYGILQETVSLKQCLGILLALVAIYLMST